MNEHTSGKTSLNECTLRSMSSHSFSRNQSGMPSLLLSKVSKYLHARKCMQQQDWIRDEIIPPNNTSPAATAYNHPAMNPFTAGT